MHPQQEEKAEFQMTDALRLATLEDCTAALKLADEQDPTDDATSEVAWQMKSKGMVPDSGTEKMKENSIETNPLHLKAMKADDVRVQVEKWDHGLAAMMGVGEGKQWAQAAETIQTFCFRRWRRRLGRSFLCWLHQKTDYQGVGLDDMSRIVERVQVSMVKTPFSQGRTLSQ
jgi:hypothetical protein